MDPSMQEEYYNSRQNGIKDVIKESKRSLESAISNLNLNEDADHHLDTSYLDCAIHISLMILELQLYNRIIEGNDIKISQNAVQQV